MVSAGYPLASDKWVQRSTMFDTKHDWRIVSYNDNKSMIRIYNLVNMF